MHKGRHPGSRLDVSACSERDHPERCTRAFEGKPSFLTFLIDEGIITDTSDEQPAKTLSPSAVTDEGISTDASDEQPTKAWFPSAVTDEGISTDTTDEQP